MAISGDFRWPPLGRISWPPSVGASTLSSAPLTGHFLLLALLILYVAVRGMGVALWEGIRPRVVAFGSVSAFRSSAGFGAS